MSDLPEFYANLDEYPSTQAYTAKFYEAAAESGLLFRRPDGSLTYISPHGPRRLLTKDAFLSMSIDILRITRSRAGSSKPAIPSLLSPYEVAALFGSSASSFLPTIKHIVYDPVVAPNGSAYLVDKPGYHPAVETYYWKAADRPFIEPLPSTEHLERCFSGVPFMHTRDPSNTYRNNLFAWLVGGVSLEELWPPLLAISGNICGVGKTSLIHAVSIILTGGTQRFISGRDSEFEKELGALFREEKNLVIFDNVDPDATVFHSRKLCELLTSGTEKSVRMLGQSRHIVQTGVKFALTANNCRLSPDLSSRALPVRLHQESARHLTPFCVAYAEAHRSEIYGELLHLALTREANAPIPDTYQSYRFVSWLQFVLPAISKFGGLTNSQEVDLGGRHQELFGWAHDQLIDHGSVLPFTAAELYQKIIERPEKWPSFSAEQARAVSRWSSVRKIAAFLKENVNRAFNVDDEITLSLIVDKPPTKDKGTIYTITVTQGESS